MSTLATIAAVAPFVGVLGTLIGIMTSFRGVDGERSALMAALAELLAEAVVPTAFGLLIALFASWCYHRCQRSVEAFDTEMDNATLDMINVLFASARQAASLT